MADKIRFGVQHLDPKTGGYREATVEVTLDTHHVSSFVILPQEGTLQDEPEPTDDVEVDDEAELADDAPEPKKQSFLSRRRGR